MKSGSLLDVIVRKGAAILELFSSEDETLLIRQDALVLYLLELKSPVRFRFFCLFWNNCDCNQSQKIPEMEKTGLNHL